jgi:hypothetical protein
MTLKNAQEHLEPLMHVAPLCLPCFSPQNKKLNIFASQKETTQINLNDMFETNSSDILVDDIN